MSPRETPQYVYGFTMKIQYNGGGCASVVAVAVAVVVVVVCVAVVACARIFFSIRMKCFCACDATWVGVRVGTKCLLTSFQRPRPKCSIPLRNASCSSFVHGTAIFRAIVATDGQTNSDDAPILGRRQSG